ncbi:MAG TPA: molybdate ABC transporter substrate-binding protein [Longimicrobium sp.]|nr:molybdate ABC transporter substrate-binding protein [Longimicrobium sp.]
MRSDLTDGRARGPRRPWRIAAVAALAFAAACGGETKDARAPGEVMVFAAASLRESLEELGAAFQRQTGTRVAFNFAGSNDLAHQIDAARGMDLFLSASPAWMDTVQHAGRVAPGTRRDLLSNTLVIVANTRQTWSMAEPCALAGLPFKNLAMGDPQAVPAGIYARKWMAGMQCGGRPLWDAVRARVAPTPDVRAAIGLVASDPGVAGMVYRTDQLAFAGRTRVLYEVTDGPPIRYTLARLAEGRNAGGAKAFADYLAGPDAARVFARHGFIPLNGPRAARP